MPKPKETASAPAIVYELVVENFKRIEALRIVPKGRVVYLNGEPDQGKSSTTEAMMACLLGKIAFPKEPVRRGAKSARVKIDTGKLIVEREIMPDGTHKFRVLSSDPNVRVDQASLSRMLGQVAVDPFEFAGLPAKEQAARLREACGVDTTALDLARADAYDERTAVGRTLKQLEGKVAQSPLAGPLAQPVDTAALLSQQSALMDDRAAIDEQLAVLSRKLREADATNNLVQQQARRREDLAEIDASRAMVESLAARIEAIDQEKLDTLKAVPMPVEGLELVPDAVLFQGVPLEQAGDSTRLEVAVALAFSLNPELRIVFIRQGSLMGEKALERVAAMAEKHQGQVWIEKVSPNGPVGFLIEDGKVAAIDGVRTEG